MSQHPIRVGINIPAKPPISTVKLGIRGARLAGLSPAMFWDHFQDFFPQALWNEDFSWYARDNPWAHEHYEYQVLLGHLASIAGNMSLGVGVTEPLRRHPVLIAQAMMTLSHVTKRLPVLGLGAGERENTEPYGISTDRPVGKLEEALQITRMCFTSRGAFDFHGEHFQLNNAVMDLVPEDGLAPPIWIAAHGPRMLRLTGEYGDGWLPTISYTPEEYGDRLSTIRGHAASAGRDPDAIRPAMQTQVVLAPSDEEARALLREPIARYVGLMIPHEVYERNGLTHPFGEDFRGFVDVLPEELTEAQLASAIEQVPPEFLEENIIWGSPERVATHIRALGDAGLRHFIVVPVSVAISQRMLYYLPLGLFRLRRKLM